MKQIFTTLAFFGALSTTQAQFVDFLTLGLDDIQKGDFAVADIDNDGDLDIIFSGEHSNGNEKGAVLINDGDGNFTPQNGDRVIRMGKSGNIQFGDIDGDGDLDVIFAGWGVGDITNVGIALNDGSGVYTLADEAEYPVNKSDRGAASCGFADFNLDGRLDYYFFAEGLEKCAIYFRQPDGAFEASTTSFASYDFNEPEVTVVDFDNDGYPDIFVTAWNNTEKDRFSALFKNDGFGNFTEFAGVSIYKQKANGTTSWGDVNGDGYLDLLLNGDGFAKTGESSDGIVRLYKNDGGLSTSVGQTFGESESDDNWYRQNGVGNGSVIVDWDNDGNLDLIIGGWNDKRKKQETALFLCSDPSSFSFTRSNLSDVYFPGISEQGFRVADLNGDNKVDLLICGYSGGAMDFNRRIVGYVPNQSPTASVLPEAPTNLSINISKSEDGGVIAAFSWEHTADGKGGVTYNLALKSVTTGKWLYNPMAVVDEVNNGWRKVAGRMGNVFANTKYELYDLPEGEYEWTVQAINGAYLGGAFAETKTFTVSYSDMPGNPDDGNGNPDDGNNPSNPDDGKDSETSALAETLGLKIYPNPVRKELNISVTGKIAQVELVSLTGEKALSRKVHGVTSYTLDMQNIATGSYVLVVTLENGAVVTQVIAKQ
ncbi:MAG: T9SS type A sorting domain-containing protein [Prevotellaceae bacterium]|jgi:hypothetical protein|nr:T9SS type A sorting domain-containing protein [Prevotellaceae bacterium]